MAALIPLISITVQRDGVNLIPKINEPFEFTDSEVKDIMKVAPKGVRKPVNESAEKGAETAKPAKGAETAKPAKGGKGGKGGKSTPATGGEGAETAKPAKGGEGGKSTPATGGEGQTDGQAGAATGEEEL